jgi:DegV family protein with EDD domain
MPVRIVSDSSCDLTAEEASDLSVGIVPLSIRFGDEEFTDREQLTPEEFYRRMAATDVLPETAAPSPGAFDQAFRQAAADGADAVVCINISRELSATGEAAQQAARALEGEIDVRVLDSKSITSGLGTIVLRAARAAKEGKSADEITALVDSLVPRTRVYGALDTLDNLKKGGRIGGAQAFIGSMLSIKPIIDISTGKVEEAAKQRTRKKSLAWLRDTINAAGAVEDLAIMHADANDVDEFIAQVRSDHPDLEVRTGYIGAVIGTHGGRGTVGATWLDPVRDT